jgi:rare lipoprotein A
MRIRFTTTLLTLLVALSGAGVLADAACASTGGAASPTAATPGSSSTPASTTSTPSTKVPKTALATWFGPGFYGQHTACGQTLTPDTLGVANRKLPCGTLVKVTYRDQALTIPVVDRGPYANGADWDLTEATARALGMAGTTKIGAVSLPPQPALP